MFWDTDDGFLTTPAMSRLWASVMTCGLWTRHCLRSVYGFLSTWKFRKVLYVVKHVHDSSDDLMVYSTIGGGGGGREGACYQYISANNNSTVRHQLDLNNFNHFICRVQVKTVLSSIIEVVIANVTKFRQFNEKEQLLTLLYFKTYSVEDNDLKKT